MKKYYLGLLLLISVLLSSCNSLTEATAQMPAITEALPIEIPTTIVEETILPSETVMSEETIETTVRTQENIDAAWEARLQDTTDVDLSAVRITDGKIQVSDEYPELKTVVDAIVEEHESIASNLGIAMGHYMITRFDSKCLCFIYDGCNNPSSTVWSYKPYNFRLDGTELELEDVVTDIELYCEYGAEIINSYDVYTYVIDGDIIDVSEVILGLRSYQWLMTESSIVFYSKRYVITGIPYKQTADLINPEFLPNGRNCYGTSNYGTIEFSSNEFVSGNESVPRIEEDTLFPSINCISINYVSDLAERGYECGYYGDCFPQYLRIDDRAYVYFFGHGEYDDVHFAALYEITDGTPQFLYGSDAESFVNDPMDIVNLVG